MSTKPANRPNLSKELVVVTGIAIADAGGLEALSMRAVARELGVTPMSIYKHLSNKDEMLDLMMDAVISEIELPDEDDWKTAVRRSAISARDVLLRHGWACALWLSRQSYDTARMRHGDWLLARLAEGGLSPDGVYHAFHILESQILGSTLQQLSFPYAGDELARLAHGFFEESPIERYPDLLSHVEAHLSPREEIEDGFEFGIDLILDGLERMRA